MSEDNNASRSLEQTSEGEPPSKRLKLTSDSEPETTDSLPKAYDVEGLLPPSTSLLGLQVEHYVFQGSERDVVRFTDFLVYEVDLEGNVVHVRDMGKPEGIKPKITPVEAPPVDAQALEDGKWNADLEAKLSDLVSEEVREKIKELYEEGPEPPLALTSDSGWGGRSRSRRSPPSRLTRVEGEVVGEGEWEEGGEGDEVVPNGKIQGPIASKEIRTSLHQTVRALFNGKLETETSETPGEEGSRVVIKWAHRGSGKGGRGRGGGRYQGDRSTPLIPPYIHFTLQKTNRDTQDALGHISRLLKVPARELSTAGTKDKRGVTTQRVCLKRGRLTVEDVWKMANGVGSRRTPEDVLTQRGERGVRVSDIAYRRGYLELGMLRGNEFVITLRNVKADSTDTIDKAMNSLKENGFINYYGMQRFGTSAIPTHSIGLAILRSNWQHATSLLLRPRPGEYPDAEAGRRAWLENGDLTEALRLIPRRCVAERCILENYKKHDYSDRNLLGGLSAIPRNLRLMYVHAYQSYVWNCIVSERIRLFGRKPIVGDLVYEDEEAQVDTMAEGQDDKDDIAIQVLKTSEGGEKIEESTGDDTSEKTTKEWKSSKRLAPRKVKVITEGDLPKYSMFDVVMPLPGTDVAYPGGKLGEMYRRFLLVDGLDPDNFNHKQKDYALAGSYRKIIHHPKALSWTIMRYTDPNVPLAQSDEDAILGLDKPTTEENGKFLALQIRLTLGTAAYATMALREVTKTETSSYHQTNLTLASEDQVYRDTAKATTDIAAEAGPSELLDADATMGDLEVDGEPIA
ncbi:pseudouridine synthase [Ceratobasidium sp. AG-Ba]|nr:pseudouridine synthase [Ceratobasidium sp. AG-Ba]QRW01993.1 pseudouridine synthase [Ceratobasidium sp. AG-Ba]